MQQKAWQDLTRKDLGFLNVLSSIFVNTENRDPNVISNVRSAECLFIGSDYGGQHSGSAYQTFAFLIADMNECAEWQNPREQIRRQNNLGRRRISFKDLNDSRRANALYDFLESTNMIGGMLIVFAIHKNSGSLFGIKKIVPADLEYDPLKKLSAPVAEKFMRVVTFLGFLIAGFSAPGQNILWVTDEDDIAANSNRVGHLAEALGLTMNQILSHKIQHLRVATAKQDKGDLSTEDLLAISDIAAGSICEYLVDAE